MSTKLCILQLHSDIFSQTNLKKFPSPNIIQLHGCVPFYIQRLSQTFTIIHLHERNLQTKKKLTPVQIMNSASLNSKNTMISVGTLNNIDNGMNNVSFEYPVMNNNPYA